MGWLTSLVPPLRIHIWGGFGSQLFAAYLIIRIKEKFPNRRIIALIHTSGVTKREIEFDFSSLNVQYTQIEDFKKAPLGVKSESKDVYLGLSKQFKLIALSVLRLTRLLSDANNEISFNRIKPWTVSIRGHYTNLLLDSKLVDVLFSSLFSSSKLPGKQVALIVHYRLGDLLTLDTKNPIEIARVESILFKWDYSKSNLIVLTDSSSEDFYEFAKNSTIFERCEVQHHKPVESLAMCISAQAFIGTGAKISIWAATFRQYKYNLPSFLPMELKWAERNGLRTIWY